MKTPLIMNQLMELPPSFYHKAPDGYSYECEEYKKNLLRIWLLHPDIFSYTTDRVRTIWGFYNPKKDQYFSPINSIRKGELIDIDDTRQYTSMKINYKGLEAFFV
jgi:hypothetical protein